MRSLATFFGLALAVTAVSGCGHMPISSIYKLRNFDPATTDLGRLRVGVRVPRLFRPRTEGVTLEVSHWRTGDKKRTKELFHLVPSRDPGDLRESVSLATDGTELYAFRLREADISRFSRIRKMISAAKKNAAKNNGAKNGPQQHASFSVGAKACRRSETLPRRLPISTFLKTGRTGEFVPVLVDFNVLTKVKRSHIAKTVPLCAAGHN